MRTGAVGATTLRSLAIKPRDRFSPVSPHANHREHSTALPDDAVPLARPKLVDLLENDLVE